MSISAITDKDTFHREVSVSLQARIPSTERYQMPPLARISSIRDVSVLSQARMLPQKHQCFPATTLEQGLVPTKDTSAPDWTVSG